MVNIQRFEGLLEALEKEIDELPQGSVKNNIIDIHTALYSIFEEAGLIDIDKIEEENTIMKELLADRLTYEEKQYYKFKNGLEVGVGYGITL